MKRTEQEVEKLIYEQLNADKPDRSIINAAEKLMVDNQKKRKEKTQPQLSKKSKHLFNGKIWASLSASVAVILVVCCFIPLMINQQEYISDDDFISHNITSIKSYNNNLLSLNYEIESSVLYCDSESSPIYIEEVYTDSNASIELYVLLDSEQMNLYVFNKFVDLNETYTIENTVIEYGDTGKECCAKFYYNNYNYFIAANVPSTEHILNYIEEMLL